MEIKQHAGDFDPRFKVFHELMSRKVRNILLVSSLYDACIMEEDCRLAERINNEYRGLNLSQPPRLSWVSSAEGALDALEQKYYDLVITMPRLADMDAYRLGRKIKKKFPDLPVILLTHSALIPECLVEDDQEGSIDRTFVWSGNADLLLAQIKSVEDRMNVEHDTKKSGVRIILFVEDSPIYMSYILPILYREVVGQTQAVLEEKLNEEDRLLTMRARAKILVAESYEEAVSLYEEFKPYILGVISDVRFPRHCELDDDAGVRLLKGIRAEIPDIPVLLTSSEPANALKAADIPAVFLDKNSSSLHSEIREFFLKYLGFGDFVYRMPNGEEYMRVSTVRALEKTLPDAPLESFIYHWSRNDFSRWLFARTETDLASKMRPITFDDFEGNLEKGRAFLINSLTARRRMRQKGVVVDFDAADFDTDTDFLKIGKGSLGGKARGLAFLNTLLHRNPQLQEKYPDVNIVIPQTLVVTTEGFDWFIDKNNLRSWSKSEATDEEIAEAFLNGLFPPFIAEDLRAYLTEIHYPLAVRSSGLLEDAQYRAYAGLYRTYMIPNNQADLEDRLKHLITAIKLVYASTYFQGPKSFAKRVGQRTEEEKMAVIVQQLIGGHYNGYFYPVVSGVAQSHNYYPFARQRPEDGIATIALGLGRTVVEGGRALRFSPNHPQVLPQFSTVDDILENAQRFFYALKMDGEPPVLDVHEESSLVKREVLDASGEEPVRTLAGTYLPEEHKIKDTMSPRGYPVLTFGSVLKYKQFPMAPMLSDVLAITHEGMGAPVEIEFSAHFGQGSERMRQFAFLQVRPMTARAESMEVNISDEEIDRAFCYSTSALGNAEREDMADIVFVRPSVFDPVNTVEIAREIGKINADLSRENRPYLLIGPGRWGSADRWLGIPVNWADISGVGAMVESVSPQLKAEPSQGSHFFHNVTTLGVNYITVLDNGTDFIDWDWLSSLPEKFSNEHLTHVRLEKSFVLKVDGRRSRCVIAA